MSLKNVNDESGVLEENSGGVEESSGLLVKTQATQSTDGRGWELPPRYVMSMAWDTNVRPIERQERGQLYPDEAVNSTQAGRSTQSVRLGKCLKHKAKGSHPLFRKGENVP